MIQIRYYIARSVIKLHHLRKVQDLYYIIYIGITSIKARFWIGR